MAVKYVKDFGFDSGFGFTGSSGKTPVRAYMRGGPVKNNPTKAPSIAPAMVEKRSQGLGGKTPETKKLAAYNKPHTEGKKGASVPQYGKGGAAKKKMPSFLKSKIAKKADGGNVDRTSLYEGDMLTYKPPADDSYVTGGRSPEEYEANLREMMERDTQRMRGDASQQMRDLASIRERESIMPVPGPGGGGSSDVMPQLKQIGSPLSQIASVPSPVKPIDYSDMPMGVMGGGDEYWKPGGEKDQQAERSRQWEISKGLRPPDSVPAPRVPAPRVPAPRVPAPRVPAPRSPLSRREVMGDRREAARNIMDRYIAGPRRAMPAPRRRAMPVAPAAAMIAPPPPAMYAKGGKVSKGQAKIGKVMGEFKRGELHSGSKKGPVVTNPKQAKAIALSEARAAGAKIPKKAMGGEIKTAVHKHERSKHPGESLTKLRKGGRACD